MGLELRQSLRMSQQLVMTPQLQQAIKMLQLSRMELQQAIREELEVNPALDEIEGASDQETGEESRESETADAPDPDADDGASELLRETAPGPEGESASDTLPSEDDGSGGGAEGSLVESAMAEAAPEKAEDGLIDRVDWDYYFGETGSVEPRGEREAADDEDGRPLYENTSVRGESLIDHLELQLRLSEADDSIRDVAAYLIGNVDEGGFLMTTVEEAAEALARPVTDVEAGLALLQSFDPTGVGARDMREGLLLQAMERGEEFSLPVLILSDHYDLFVKPDVVGIARKLKVDEGAVRDAYRKLATLDPKPGRAYSGDDTQYIVPDVEIKKVDGQWVVELREEGESRLRLSSYYRGLLRDGAALSRDEKDFIKQKVNAALWFIKSIHQRQRTIRRVVESIMKLQRDWLEIGPRGMKPLTLKDVAEDIEMHESTVSRVTSAKYADTPHGVFELKHFFSSKLDSAGAGGSVSSKSVKETIKDIVEAEGGRPMSDQEMMRMLQARGVNIARRTVTKYRLALGLLPSAKRKKIF